MHTHSDLKKTVLSNTIKLRIDVLLRQPILMVIQELCGCKKQAVTCALSTHTGNILQCNVIYSIQSLEETSLTSENASVTQI